MSKYPTKAELGDKMVLNREWYGFLQATASTPHGGTVGKGPGMYRLFWCYHTPPAPDGQAPDQSIFGRRKKVYARDYDVLRGAKMSCGCARGKVGGVKGVLPVAPTPPNSPGKRKQPHPELVEDPMGAIADVYTALLSQKAVIEAGLKVAQTQVVKFQARLDKNARDVGRCEAVLGVEPQERKRDSSEDSEIEDDEGLGCGGPAHGKHYCDCRWDSTCPWRDTTMPQGEQ